LTAYADTSFIVSLYTRDRHSAAALELMKLKPRVWFTPLHSAEFFHAVALQVFRGESPPSQAQAVYDDLKRDLGAGVWFEAPMPENAFTVCADLARLHAPKLGVRTLDSLHVACALELKADRFWTFDDRQAKLAKIQGLKMS
jgi:predicted nucleic acid-binding protein